MKKKRDVEEIVYLFSILKKHLLYVALQNDMDTLCQWAEVHGQIQKTGMDLILPVRVWYIRSFCPN